MEKIYNILTKKFNSVSLSKNDHEILESWLSSVNNQKLFKEYEKVWELTGKLEFVVNPNLDDEWNRFKTLRDSRKLSSKNKVRKLYVQIASAAASIIILFSIWGAYNIINEQNNTIYLSNNLEKHIVLPDNSEVWLNKQSKLTVPNRFNKKNRTVLLEGEAFFEVEKDASKPFIIKTSDNTYTKVLGTSFNLRAYATESIVELQVIRGIVEFGSEKSETAIVEKGRSISYNVIENKLNKISNINHNLISWHTKDFKFDNTQLSEVIKALERYVNREIIIPKKLDTLRFTGNFNDPTLEDIAEILSVAFNWEYKIRKDKIEFKEK
ncbi:MAG: FecR domain-containing protein [Salinivirgaceae bacterium]|nr:FecR domain-containing protein [Salinivirgaceae bacterium]